LLKIRTRPDGSAQRGPDYTDSRWGRKGIFRLISGFLGLSTTKSPALESETCGSPTKHPKYRHAPRAEGLP